MGRGYFQFSPVGRVVVDEVRSPAKAASRREFISEFIFEVVFSLCLRRGSLIIFSLINPSHAAKGEEAKPSLVHEKSAWMTQPSSFIGPDSNSSLFAAVEMSPNVPSAGSGSCLGAKGGGGLQILLEALAEKWEPGCRVGG